MNNCDLETITEEFLEIEDIVKRDIPNISQKNQQSNESNESNESNKLHEIYQIQTTKGNNKSDLFYLGKYSELPIQNILSFNHPRYPDIKCDMVSYTLTKEEIENVQYFKMIGFLLCFSDTIICSCDFVFEPRESILLKNNKKTISDIDGQFKIILFQKQRF
jgi:hypothetical protein